MVPVTPPPSSSWISFSPDPPSRTPIKQPSSETHKYSRPKPSSHISLTPNSLPRLAGPPTKDDRAYIFCTEDEDDEELDDLFSVPSKPLPDPPASFDDRFSSFISSFDFPSPTDSSLESATTPSTLPSPIEAVLSLPITLENDEVEEIIEESQDVIASPDWDWEEEVFAPKVPASFLKHYSPHRSRHFVYTSSRASSLTGISPAVSRRPSVSSLGPPVFVVTSPKRNVRFEHHRRTPAGSPTASPKIRRSTSKMFRLAPPSPHLSPRSKKEQRDRKRRAKAEKKRCEREIAERVRREIGFDAEALDRFFGVKPDEGKAMRGGYAGLGVEGVKGWKNVDDFKSLLQQEEAQDCPSRRSSEEGGSSIGKGRIKHRPAPLDLSRARPRSRSISTTFPSTASSDDSDFELEPPLPSAHTIATPSPYVFSPDPITREIRRRASEAILSTSAMKNSQSRGLARKKSVGDLLKGFWQNVKKGGSQHSRASTAEHVNDDSRH